MKLLILLTIPLLTSCASQDFETFMSGMAGAQATQQNYGYQAPQEQRQPSTQVDMNCKRDCLSAGYNHGLCNSKCSY